MGDQRRRRARLDALLAHLADQPHAAHAPHRDEEVDRAQDRPPAVAGLVHPGIAAQPLVGSPRGPVAAEASGLDLEAEQLEPVAQPPVADELARAGQEELVVTDPQAMARAAQALPHAPQAGRIEADDYQSSFGHQHTRSLRQCDVRILRQLERVRHHDEIEAVRRERQRLGVAVQADRNGKRLWSGDRRRAAARWHRLGRRRGRRWRASDEASGWSAGRRARAGPPAARGSRRCRRRPGRSVPVPSRASTGPAASSATLPTL